MLGEVDLILGALHSEKSFDQLLKEAWLSGSSEGALDAALDDFGNKLEVARTEYDQIKEGEAILETLVQRFSTEESS